jgi:hypothetical protein
MDVLKTALIGHSGAGKSFCLGQLGIDRRTADTDAALGTEQSPPLDAALRWLTNDSRDRPLAVASNHEVRLLKMRRAKLAGLYAERFARVRLVYLCKPKDQLAQHLAKPMPGGRRRDLPSVQYTLTHYDRFHRIFADLAVHTIDCDSKSGEEVARELRSLLLLADVGG